MVDDCESKLEALSVIADDFPLNYPRHLHNLSLKIPAEFICDTSKFKIRSELLNRDVDTLNMYSEDLCDISSYAEDELNKITKFSTHLVNYINQNSEFETTIGDFIVKIRMYK